MAKGTLGQGSSREMEPKPWCGLAIQVSSEKKIKKKGKKLNITVGGSRLHSQGTRRTPVVVRSSVRGELSSLPAACICRSEKMPVGDRG